MFSNLVIREKTYAEYSDDFIFPKRDFEDDCQEIKKQENRDLLKSIVHDIAMSSLKELAVGLAMTGVTCLFVATPAMPTFFILTISIVALNVLLRSCQGCIHFILHQIEDIEENGSFRQALKDYIRLLEYMCPMTFSFLATSTVGTVIHELGHASMAKALYQNPRPTIEIFKDFSGVTRWFSSSPLTKLGNYFGKENSRLLVSMGGTLAAVGVAFIGLGSSSYYKDSNPEFSRYLFCMGVMEIFHHTMYALSALYQANPKSGHDFVFMWLKGGIHPAVSIVAMVALPLIIRASLFAVSYIQEKKSPQDWPNMTVRHERYTLKAA